MLIPRCKTAEREEIYNQIKPLLLAGESSLKLSEKTGIPAPTLRYWRRNLIHKEDKKYKKNKKIQEVTELIAVGNQLPIADNERGRTQLIADINQQINNLTEFLSGNQSDSKRALIASNSGVLAVLDKAMELITLPDIDAKELRAISASINESVKNITALHLLPFGHINPSLALQPQRSPSQHLHLHSSGSRSKPKQIGGIKAEIVDAAFEDTTPIQSGITANQRDLLENV